MAYYEHNVTGKRSFHPKSGIGASLNATEIGEDGKAVKPRTSLAPTKAELKAGKEALRDRTGSPSRSTKTTEAKTGTGESKQEGAH